MERLESIVAKNAVENNHLKKGQREYFRAKMKACTKSKNPTLCSFKVDDEIDQVSLKNTQRVVVLHVIKVSIPQNVLS